MRKTTLFTLIFSFALVSCLDPDPIKETSKKSNGSGEIKFSEKVDSSGVAAKNFAQINNTYATLTGVSMGEVSAEYALIKTQLPSTSNPRSLNGFNQIASTRLAFAYCNEYIDAKAELVSMDNEKAINSMLDGFIDIDPTANAEHANMVTHLKSLMNNEDSLISDNNSTSKKKKLLKISCTAILSSSYVTLI